MTNTEEIKSKLDIVELIQEYIPLKQSGVNFKGLCPFHNEKTPSFIVSREKQFFKCFGCGEGGDIFSFFQKIENIEFPEALKILADKAGVELKHQNFNPQFQNLKTRLYELNEIAINFYQDQFFNSLQAKNAREYLINKRKLNKDIINEFQIGYALDSWDAVSKFLKTRGFSDNEILQSGLVVEKNNYSGVRNYYDRFRDRIMFPISDHNKNIVGFTARAMSTDPNFSGGKYINTPQTAIYNKSQILYGLYKAKKSIRELNFVILVEGNMDVVASHKAGVKNVVASSGTALTEDQIKILKRYTNNLTMCFDSDVAGIIAAEKGIELAWQAGVNVKVIILPTKIKDPDELVQKSPDAWRKAVNKKINFMDYFFQINLAEKDLNNIDVKRETARKILPWIAKLFDPIEKDFYLKKLSTAISIDENSLREALNKFSNIRLGFKTQSNNKNKNISTKQEGSTQEGWSQQITDKQNIKINKNYIISQRLLALGLRSEEYLEELVSKILPELIENSFQEFYKQIILYYTKNNPEYSGQDLINNFYNHLKTKKTDLVVIFDTLKLLGENEFVEMSKRELNREFDLAVNFLKKENVSTKLKNIEVEIKLAEQKNEFEKIEKLMKEFSLLSGELKGL